MLSFCENLSITESIYHTIPTVTEGFLDAVTTISKATNYNLRRLNVHLTSPLTNEILESMSKYCPRLEYLEFNLATNLHTPNDGIASMARMCCNLKTVKIEGCLSRSLMDISLPTVFVKSCRRLKHLEVKWCLFKVVKEAYIDDYYVSESKLEVLDFSHCFNMRLEIFKSIVEKSRKTLRKFKLSQIPLAQYDATTAFLGTLDFPALSEFFLQPAGLTELTSDLVYRLNPTMHTTEGLCRFFKNTHRLEVLSIPRCVRLSDDALMQVGKNCPRLKHLDIAGCASISNVSVVSILSKCSQLEGLNISGCSGVLGCILNAVAKYCKEIKVCSCSNVTNSGVCTLITEARGLQTLSITNSASFTSVGELDKTTSMKALEHVQINDCEGLTDEAIITLSKLSPNLVTVNLNGCTKLSDAAIIALARHCPKLTVVHLSHCNIGDASIEAIARLCPHLESIAVSHCSRLTDHCIAALVRFCSRLTSIDIMDTPLTDRSIQELALHTKAIMLLKCDIEKFSYETVEKFRQANPQCHRRTAAN